MSEDEPKLSTGLPEKPIDIVTVVHAFQTNKRNQLTLFPGETVYVLSKTQSGWWDGVVVTPSGKLVRGWFPQNHTKSSKKKEPAGILHYPGSGRASRKNSAVSFASSQSFKSDYKITSRRRSLFSMLSGTQSPDARVDPLDRSVGAESVGSGSQGAESCAYSQTNDTQGSQSQDLNHSSLKLLPMSEIEMLMSTLKHPPVWIPVLTSDNTVVYYCLELDVHSKELPLFGAPKFTGVPRVRSYLSLRSRDMRLGTDSLTQSPAPASHSQPLSTRSSTAGSFQPRLNSQGSRVTSEGSRVTGVATRHDSEPDARPRVVYYSSAAQFYTEPLDISTWPSLKEALLYYSQKTIDSLARQSRSGFDSNFEILARLAVMFHLAGRLLRENLVRAGRDAVVKRRLLRITNNIAHITINANLVFSVAASRDISSATRGITRASTATLDAGAGSGSGSGCGSRASSGAGSQSQRTVSTSTTGTLHDEEDTMERDIHVTTLVQRVESELMSLRKNALEIIGVMTKMAMEEGNSEFKLPQMYPRFFRDKFSGGQWQNQFLEKVSRRNKVPLDNDLVEYCSSIMARTMPLVESVKEALEKPNTAKRNLEIGVLTYKVLSIVSGMMEILEGIDLSVFNNLRQLSELEEATEELKRHALASSYPVLLEFFEVKQALHDIAMRGIMDAQLLSLDDPDTFKSVGRDSEEKHQFVEPEKSAEALRKHLVLRDVETKDNAFVLGDSTFKDIVVKYVAVMRAIISVVVQLVEERETILNYATRTMNSDLAVVLLAGEQQWDEDSEHEVLSPRHSVAHNGAWFLDSGEQELVVDTLGNIKGGTKAALVEHLTSHTLLDTSFNVTMLTTFRSMMSTTEFVGLLIERFNNPPPEGLSFDEYNLWVEKKLFPIKNKVLNIMVTFLQSYWCPQYYEPGLDVWLRFAKMLSVQSFPQAETLLKEVSLNVKPPGRKSGPQAQPQPKRKKPKTMLLEWEPMELAKQLTIRESELYMNIKPFQCLDRCWGNKYGEMGGSQEITDFIASSNLLTNYVSYSILQPKDAMRRVTIIKYFIDVAQRCYELRNFSSMTAIISSLYSSPIHRLKKTWEMVNKEHMAVLEKLNTLMDSTRNFAKYREMMKSVTGQCVPFFGVYLSDLTFAMNGNPDFLHGTTDIINFGKRSKLTEILKNVTKFQSLPYHLAKNDAFQSFIQANFQNIPSIDTQYEMSLKIEPRLNVASGLNSTNANYAGNTFMMGDRRASVRILNDRIDRPQRLETGVRSNLNHDALASNDTHDTSLAQPHE